MIAPVTNRLERDGRPALAYRLEPGDDARPAILLLGGFAADMSGTKAEYLSGRCRALGLTYVRFDYRGHGLSEGNFMDGTIGDWLLDALDIIDRIMPENFILVGSSMGGWIGLLAALARPSRACGFIGIAAAPDFTRDIMPRLGPGELAQLSHQGYFELPRDGGMAPTPVTQTLLSEGERHCLLDRPIAISCPVRLMQGRLDDQVPYQTAIRIMERLETADKTLCLIDGGDHRLVRDEDLALLGQLVEELAGPP